MKAAIEDDEEVLVTTEIEEGRHSWTSWKALFSFTSKIHVFVLIPGVLLSTAAGILQPSMALFFGKFFNSFSDFGAGKIDGPELMSKTLIDVYALIGIGAATWTLKGGYFATWLVFGELQAKAVRDELFQSLLEKDLEWYEMRKSGVASLLSRLQTQIRELQIGTSQPLGFTFNYIVQICASLGLALYYSWKLTLVILAGLPVSAIILFFISSGMQDNILAQQEETAKGSALANNAFSNIVLVKCSNTQDYEGKRYVNRVREAAKYYVRLARVNALQIGFVRFASTAMFVQGFYYGSHLAHSGNLSAGNVVTTFWSALMATKAFEDILPHVIVLEKGKAAAAALKAVLDRVGKGGKVGKDIGGSTPHFLEGDIEVRNVSFAYPSRPELLVLQDSTFFFPAGEVTFIVGKSGSGKSTLGNLLMRFYQPASGQILIDGQPIEDLDMGWLRNNITLVQQQSILFNETIFRNIAFGYQDHTRVTLKQVKECIALSSLQNTINDLPNGLNTMVGAGGSALSGGQKQRIAVARARLRSTGILILDESTSALDYISRTSVMTAIRQWRKGRTTIVITHDMSQIQDDDFVYVLEEGQIVQEGYRHNVIRDMERGLFQSDIQRPQISATTHYAVSPVSPMSPRSNFDFGWSATPQFSILTTRVLASEPNPWIERQDSIDFQLDSFAEGSLVGVPIKPAGTLSRAVSNRLSGGAKIFFGNLKRHSSLQAPSFLSPYPPFTLERGAEQIRRATTRATRPMSIHQPIVMRSTHMESSTRQEPRSTRPFLDTPKLLKRISVRNSKQQPLPTAHVPQAISVKDILATVWPSINKKDRAFLAFGFLAAFVHSASLPSFSYILVQLFQTFYMKQNHAQKSLIYALAILGIAIVDGIACYHMHYLLEAASQSWVDSLRIKAITRILDQPKSWFDDDRNSPSYLTSALDRNAEEMRNLVGRFAAFILVVACMMTIAITWSMITCWKVTLVALASAPVLYLVTKGFTGVSSRWESRTNNASETVGSIFVETFTDIRTVRALTLESYFHKKYTLATSAALFVGLKRALYSGFFFGMSDSAINFVTALIFWFGAHLAKSYSYSVESILTVFSLLLFSTANANAIAAYIPQISSSADTASRLLHLAQTPLLSHEHSGHHRVNSRDPFALSGPINFIDLTFYYPTRPESPALDRLNLTIPAGYATAIVGASGSGKSTIASLLLGLYPPTADAEARTLSDSSKSPTSLAISGRDIRSLHLPTLRSLIAVVPQTPVLFPDTVRGNIVYGLELGSELTTQESIESAARRAGIHEFILTLPKSYDTVVGESGLGLSGGQAQRVVIARALVRRPRILVLDEATSALDGESAAVVRKAIMGLVEEERGKARGRERALTVIIITHSKEMMECAENVVVLEKGRVVEEGGFEELCEKRGRLWEMLKVGGVV